MARLNKFFIITIFCYLSFFFLTGCAGFSKKDTTAEIPALEPSVIQKFKDIPVPQGFKLLLADSYAFQSGNIRVGVLAYSGRATADRLVDFYQNQMPIYNWTFLNVIEYGKRMLNFDRENESCVISIEPKMLSTRVVISIGPKQQIPKKSKQPVK